MKEIFDTVSYRSSEITTKLYSTSFSFGIKALDKELHKPIYAIYGFVRLADKSLIPMILIRELTVEI